MPLSCCNLLNKVHRPLATHVRLNISHFMTWQLTLVLYSHFLTRPVFPVVPTYGAALSIRYDTSSRDTAVEPLRKQLNFWAGVTCWHYPGFWVGRFGSHVLSKKRRLIAPVFAFSRWRAPLCTDTWHGVNWVTGSAGRFLRRITCRIQLILRSWALSRGVNSKAPKEFTE